MKAKDKVFYKKKILNVGGKVISVDPPLVMAILNVTPDSFYEGSHNTNVESILKNTEKHISDGADIIDIGGYSTRPGAEQISDEEELRRVLLAVNAIKKEFPDAILSIDTFRSTVARAALESGAHIINDVSGGTLDSEMFKMIGKYKVPYILMHMRGTPKTMQHKTEYTNIVQEVISELQRKLFELEQLGVKDVIIDPGFGFAKTVDQNYTLLHEMDYLKILERPILVGISRKSMIWRTLQTDASEALNGTTVLNTISLLKGADILRVHDVKEAKETITLINQTTH